MTSVFSITILKVEDNSNASKILSENHFQPGILYHPNTRIGRELDTSNILFLTKVLLYNMLCQNKNTEHVVGEKN